MELEEQYELTDETKIAMDGVTKLFRLRAKVEFKNKYRVIKKGELGGWLESLKLKSGNARVCGNARVSDNAWVSGNAEVYGDARVSDNAWVSGNAEVSGRFNLTVNVDFELPRITIDTNEKLIKLKKFLEGF